MACLRYLRLPGIVTWFFAGKGLERKSLDPECLALRAVVHESDPEVRAHSGAYYRTKLVRGL